jgi:hypothetical protein
MLIVYSSKSRPFELSIGETGGLQERGILELVDWGTYYEQNYSVLAVDVCRVVAISAPKLLPSVFSTTSSIERRAVKSLLSE